MFGKEVSTNGMAANPPAPLPISPFRSGSGRFYRKTRLTDFRELKPQTTHRYLALGPFIFPVSSADCNAPKACFTAFLYLFANGQALPLDHQQRECGVNGPSQLMINHWTNNDFFDPKPNQNPFPIPNWSRLPSVVPFTLRYWFSKAIRENSFGVMRFVKFCRDARPIPVLQVVEIGDRTLIVPAQREVNGSLRLLFPKMCTVHSDDLRNDPKSRNYEVELRGGLINFFAPFGIDLFQ